MLVNAILDFQKVENFNFQSGSEAQCASSYQISWRSVKRFADVEKNELRKKDRSPKIYKNWYLGRLGVTQIHWQCYHY